MSSLYENSVVLRNYLDGRELMFYVKRRLLHAYFARGCSCEDRLESHDKCASKRLERGRI